MIEKPNSFCQVECRALLPCKKPEHKCTKTCFPKHDHSKCLYPVFESFPICGHPVRRKCYEDLSTMKCLVDVTIRLSQCGHVMTKKCHQSEDQVSCNKPCPQFNDCGLHSCKQVCGESHGHSICNELVDYRFPGCNHPSPRKKKCTVQITWECKKSEKVTLLCGHEEMKECWQKVSDICCERPCEKMRICKHPCKEKCGIDCEANKCRLCELELKKQIEQTKKLAEQRIKECEKKIKDGDRHQLIELDKNGISTAAQYLAVEDKVLKNIQPVHNWYPEITKIQEIYNPKLELRFEKAKLECFGTYVEQKFHGTKDIGINNIPKDGFRQPQDPKPGERRGMYGQGIYFATDSSKSAQEIYTGGSNKLLLCDVLLGKSKKVMKADPSITLHKIRKEGYDSVFAPRNSKSSGGVMNDEFVIYDSRQALPKYIIHFRKTGSPNIPAMTPLASLAGMPFKLTKIQAARTVNLNDPYEAHFSRAASIFHQANGQQRGQSKFKVKSIQLVYNQVLENAYEAKKQEFTRKGIPSNEVFAFHGTSAQNVDSIARSNLQYQNYPTIHGKVHGPGNYFSEFPDFSLGYGAGLILFRILPGREYEGPIRDVPPNYETKKVGGNTQGFGQMLIIKDSAQFLPYAIYELENV